MSKDTRDNSYTSMKDEEVEAGMLDDSNLKQSSTEIDYKTRFKRTAWLLALMTILLVVLVSVLGLLVVQQQARLNQTLNSGLEDHHHQTGNKRVACVECFDFLPDECRLARVSFADFAKDIPDQTKNFERYERWQYNGNMGPKSTKFESNTYARTAIRAMLGDVTARKESLIFRWVRDALHQRNTTFDPSSRFYSKYTEMVKDLVESAWEYLEGHLAVEPGSEVSGLQSMCATEYAFNAYYSRLSRTELTSLAINYSSPLYDNDGATEVWTTLYQEIAAEYGPLVVVFSPEERPRSVDLNLWNLASNGYFLMKKNTTWDDTGEFIAPAFRYSKEVVGMLLFRKTNSTNTTQPRICNTTKLRPMIEDIPYHDLIFAFYKVEYNQKSYVVVLDGHMQNGNFTNCIEPGPDGYHYHCQYAPWRFTDPTPDFPTLLPERCRAIGFLCADTVGAHRRCKPPLGLISKYQDLKSEYTLSPSTMSYLGNVTWSDPYRPYIQKQLSFYPLNSTAIADNSSREVVLERAPWIDPGTSSCINVTVV